jgi:hypothetical protein
MITHGANSGNGCFGEMNTLAKSDYGDARYTLTK